MPTYSYMRPAFTCNDPADCGFVDGEPLCKFRLANSVSMESPNGSYGFDRQSRMWQRLASRLAILPHLVYRIVGACPKKEMIRSHAQRGIAAVQDAFIGDRSTPAFIRQAVGKTSPTVHAHDAVSVRGGTHPHPATISAHNSGVKAFLPWPISFGVW